MWLHASKVSNCRYASLTADQGLNNGGPTIACNTYRSLDLGLPEVRSWQRLLSAGSQSLAFMGNHTLSTCTSIGNGVASAMHIGHKNRGADSMIGLQPGILLHGLCHVIGGQTASCLMQAQRDTVLGDDWTHTQPVPTGAIPSGCCSCLLCFQ